MSKVIKNSFFYITSSVLQKGIGFLLLPIYTSHLSRDDYGLVTIVTTITAVLSIVFSLGLPSALVRFYYEYKDQREQLNQYVSTILWVIGIVSFISITVIIVLNKIFISIVASNVAFYPYFLLGLFIIMISPVYTLYQTLLQIRQEGRLYSINSFMFFLCNLVFTIIFVVFFKMKALGILTASGITTLIFSGYAVFQMRTYLSFSINLTLLRISINYSLPLLPHQLSSWVMSLIDRLLINNIVSLAMVGIYNIGFQFASILSIITMAVNQAYVPWFYSVLKEKSDRTKLLDFADSVITLYCFVAFCFSLLCYDILLVMVSKHFRAASIVIPFLLFSNVFGGVYYFFVNPLFYNYRGTKYIPLVTFISATIGVVLNLFFIPRFGVVGAASVSIITYLFASLMALFIGKRIEPIGFRWLKMYFIVIFSFIITLLFIHLNLRLFDKIVIIMLTSGVLMYYFRSHIVLLISYIKKNLRTRCKK